MESVDRGGVAMNRGWLLAMVLLIVGAGCAWVGVQAYGKAKDPIRVGLLHSQSGPLAVSEASMVDAEVFALEQLNAQGGLLGRRIEWVIADGRSDPATFAREAERLIASEKVSVIFGCLSSSCRKAVKPVVERTNHMLVYPVAYEGMEASPNIIYTGAAPNQQIIPTVKWSRDILKAKTYFLIGTDYVWPRAANEVVKDQLKALGATILGEEYLPENGAGLDAALEKAVKAHPDVILSTIVGDANLPFYQKIRAPGGQCLKIPVITLPVTEEELRELPVMEMINDYAVCNYFQSIDRPENIAFVKAFKTRFGQDRVTSDPINTAYNSVKLWAQAVSEAESSVVHEVYKTMQRQSLNAAEGVISIDRETKHTWRPFFVGRIRGDGQVEIIWTIDKPIKPTPYPFSRTKLEWNAFIDALYKGWGGNWSAPMKERGR